MSKNKKIVLYFVLGFVFVIASVVAITVFPKGDVVTIKSNGEIIETVRLSAVTEEYEIMAEHSGYNKIKINNSGAFVYEADCPDKLCIEQSNSGIYPIVCLPHKLVIEKTDSN